MIYYIDTIEQVKGENDTVKNFTDNDDIRIVDTTGGVLKKDSVGQMVE